MQQNFESRKEGKKITTADIKMLIKECLADGDAHTVQEFREYISFRKGDDFTRGQISGAVFQLSSGGVIKSVERGLYVKADTDESCDIGETIEITNSTPVSMNFRNQVEKCLEEMDERLNEIVKDTDVWNLDDNSFEYLREVRRLREWIMRLKNSN